LEVVPDRVLTNDIDGKAAGRVGALSGSDQLLHRRGLRLVAQHDGQQRGMAIARDEHVTAWITEGGNALDVWLTAKFSGQRANATRKRSIGHPQALRPHSHQLVDRVGAGHALLDEILRSQRLRLGCHGAVAGQRR
jgi:hypothetical protein